MAKALLLVNPHSPDALAMAAIGKALDMPIEERKSALSSDDQATVREDNVREWTSAFLRRSWQPVKAER